MIATRLHFTQELTLVEDSLLKMGSTVRGMVSRAVSAFQQADVSIVSQVLADDSIVDRLEEEIEGTCLRLLALQQPMARDLRRISSAIKVASEIERVGDHAVEIAKNTRKLIHRCFHPRPLIDVAPMQAAVQSMFDKSLQAFIDHNVEMVRQVCEADDLVDDMQRALREELFQMAQEDASLIAAASYTLLIVVSLERIADHATSIAERVAFIETGDLHRMAHDHKRTLSETVAATVAGGY